MTKLITSPCGHRLLLIWRSEFLFYTPERRRLAEEWNHVCLTSAAGPEQPGLINHRLDQPLPFADESFDCIYSFHVVEHLSAAANEPFIRDILRLLKPGGTYRVSTPDMEFLASEYLQRLHERMASASTASEARYRWALCNLIDQSVREVTGGEMLKIMERGEYDREHVKHMNGDLLDYLLPLLPAAAPRSRTRLARFHNDPIGFLRNIPAAIGRRITGSFSPKTGTEFTFERNLWLFDRISLAQLLSAAGFRNISAKDHQTSAIPNWNRYNFDQSAFGDYPLEPSLYMEGTK